LPFFSLGYFIADSEPDLAAYCPQCIPVIIAASAPFPVRLNQDNQNAEGQ